MKLMNKPNQQQGMTLLVALVTLIVLMMLGIGAMTASTTMLKLAGNLQFENEAKNRAETALANAENALIANVNASAMAASNLPVTPENWPNGLVAVSGVITQRITTAPVVASNSAPCMVDCLNVKTASFQLYRLTAQGASNRGATRYVESIVQIPAN